MGGGGSVAEAVARTDKEQPPAVFQREREREGGVEKSMQRGERERGSECVRVCVYVCVREERGIAGSRNSQDNRRTPPRDL